MLAALLLLASCGGGGGGGGFPIAPIAASPAPDATVPPAPVGPPPPVAPPPAAQPTTLVLSVSKLALSVNNTSLNPALTGSPRTITVTNTGLYDAKTVTSSVSPALPVDASFSSDCGQVLPAGSSCQVTFTPGAVPTAAALDATPISATLLVTGENTTATTANVRILGYGSVYQGGHVYSLDDSTPQTSSVGGKVLALSAESAGEAWGPDGVISIENSTDGRAATQAIVAQFPDQPSAAKTCTSSTMGSYADWYLPVGQEVMKNCQVAFRLLTAQHMPLQALVLTADDLALQPPLHRDQAQPFAPIHGQMRSRPGQLGSANIKEHGPILPAVVVRRHVFDG